jgi:hypothetical protein
LDGGETAEIFKQFGAGIRWTAFARAWREIEQDNVVAGKAEIDRDESAEGKEQKAGEEEHCDAEADLGGQHPAERSDAAEVPGAAGFQGGGG